LKHKFILKIYIVNPVEGVEREREEVRETESERDRE
jgi:hypothetical protein